MDEKERQSIAGLVVTLSIVSFAILMSPRPSKMISVNTGGKNTLYCVSEGIFVPNSFYIQENGKYVQFSIPDSLKQRYKSIEDSIKGSYKK